MRLFKPDKSIHVLGFCIGRLNGKFGIIQPGWFRGFLQIFTYRIMIYRNKPHTLSNACKIGYDGKYLFLLDKDDLPIPGQITISIIDKVNRPTRAKVELFVNITEIIKIER